MTLFDELGLSKLLGPIPDRETPVAHGARHFVNGRPLDPPFPLGSEQVLFGMGCFWGAERKFWQAGEGVYVTAVGYAGGVTKNPTYEDVCSGRTGHAEVVRVVYQPPAMTFEELLRIFWEGHDPTQGMRQGNDAGTQYRSALYVSTPEQLAAAKELLAVYQRVLTQAESRRDHDGNPRESAVLLRRGVSPAVSRQKSRRLLRARRNRHRLPARLLRLERFPITWNHVIDKESLKIKTLEQVLIELVCLFFRNLL